MQIIPKDASAEKEGTSQILPCACSLSQSWILDHYKDTENALIPNTASVSMSAAINHLRSRSFLIYLDK